VSNTTYYPRYDMQEEGWRRLPSVALMFFF
jgi:hypothetical protein